MAESKFVEGKEGGASITEQVLEFFYDNDDFATFFEEWCRA